MINYLPDSMTKDDFNFAFINLLQLDSIVPIVSAYGVYISQHIRYARTPVCIQTFYTVTAF